ncbi:MAG: hypothetical protein K0M55_20225 [Rhizobium sp.]|nr:hypothetical protein [Rhizobium sp.]MBW8318747.1 hypothetical protein [Rhizobium sp.]MBW8446270.1 hypothetical protein [Arenimonas sp.]
MAFWAQPLNDREVVDLFEEAQGKFPGVNGSLRAAATQLSIDNVEGQEFKLLKKNAGYSVTQFNLTYGKTTFSYRRTNDKGTGLAEVEIHINDGVKAAGLEFQFSLFALKKLGNPPSSGSALNAGNLAADVIKIESALAGAVDQFSELQRSFLEKNESLREAHANEIERLKADLELERKENVERFRSERSNLDAEIESKRQEIEKAKKDLDDRSNTFVRRAIRSEIKESITGSLASSLFSANTASQRRPVRWAYWLFIVAAAAFTIFSSYQIALLPSLEAATGIILIIKASVGGFTTIGLALLYLKWETTWINQQAEFERILSATRTDIDRASWVVESLLEWNREAQTPMPAELLAALTRRLFDWDAKLEESQSPADSLASAILGSASNLKIGPNGAELDISNRGLKRLQADQQ